MSDSIHSNQEKYTIPSSLPAPLPLKSAPPYLGLFLGILAASLLGIAMFLAGQFLYIYILYNGVAGAGVGWAIAQGVKNGKSTNKAALFIIVAVCSLIVYLSYNISYYVWVLNQVAPEKYSFFEVFWTRAQYETFIGDMELSAAGNIVIWFLEFIITLVFAWKPVSRAINICRTTEIQPEVSTFVLHLMSEERDIPYIKNELAKRGWIYQNDQTRAINAANSLVAIVQESRED